MDAWGHATQVTEANGVTLTRGYDPATGLMTSLTADNGHTVLAQYPRCVQSRAKQRSH